RHSAHMSRDGRTLDSRPTIRPPSRCPSLSSSFFFYCSRAHRALHSFPTRRSSDLDPLTGLLNHREFQEAVSRELEACRRHGESRSEEHTSELQSRSDLVCRLLLEKKKTDTTTTQDRRHHGSVKAVCTSKSSCRIVN